MRWTGALGGALAWLTFAASAQATVPKEVRDDLVNPYSIVKEPTKEPVEEPDVLDDEEAEEEEDDGEPSPDEADAGFDDDADFGGAEDAPTQRGGSLKASAATDDEAPDLVDFRIAGHAAVEGRFYFLDAVHAGQLRGDTASLVVEPELTLGIDHDTHRLIARPFYRLDPIDANRSHFDVRVGEYRLSTGSFELGVGIGQFSWGALDFHRPSDVMNQVDFVERIDGTAKLGQPYAELGYVGEAVALRFYYLPYFRERTFQGIQGRLRPAVTVGGEAELETDDAITGLGPWHPSGAARLTVVAGGFDVGIGAISGLSREPRFIAELSTGTVFPRYDLMHQASADVQWTAGPVSLKAEGFFRLWSEELRSFGGGGGGIDYSLFDLFGTGANLTFIAEFLYDSRGLDAPPTFFEHDAFGGMRLAFGDAGGTVIGGGVVADVIDGTLLGRATARRRFWDHWVLSVDGNFFMAKPTTKESAIASDSHVEVSVSYFF